MNTQVSSTRENISSLLPAVSLLTQLGYTYLTPTEANQMREHKASSVVLTRVLREQLGKLNRFEFKGKTYPFSDKNLDLAVRELANLPFASLMTTSMEVYDLLILGRSMQETIEGYVRSHQLNFIDWKNPENNVYHVSDEFRVERMGSTKTSRPDIVLFVNGIPLVVIECKRPEVGAWEGVSQTLRNQKPEEIPHLFPFAQILMALSQNNALYGATGSKKDYWGFWKEEQADQQKAELEGIINTPLDQALKKKLLSWRNPQEAAEMHQVWNAGDRLATSQDRLLHSLARPERLLEIVYGFTLFDGGIKKITRYQQYFAIKETLRRVTRMTPEMRREGGVIWHTTGSGKSLTMVMLAKALVLEPSIKDPRIVLVTDRVDLDDQIKQTFQACQKEVKQAQSGQHLLNLLKNNEAPIITTIIDKFDNARAMSQGATIDSADIFVLVDESHRSQYGSNHEKMKLLLPKACYIGFTGTPLLKQDKSTALKFGGFIHKYTMNQAVQDGAVVPLKYEGRMSDLRADQQQLDRWFDRITKDLTEDQKADLKQKFNKVQALLTSQERIAEIAYDISEHFSSTFKDPKLEPSKRLKGQFAVSSKEMAIKYQKAFQDFGKVKTEVIISPPDTREDHDDVDDLSTPLVQQFWAGMMHKYHSSENYQRTLIEKFKNTDEVDILIVVDKLLTGFDAPRNAVLYLDKTLREHNILQAIARVNRVFEGKEYGLVVDYRGIFGNLTSAIDMYAELEKEGFDLEDVQGTIENVWEDIQKLPDLHQKVWSVFSPVQNKHDPEAMQLHLEPQDIRDSFYNALKAYVRVLQLAFSNGRFIDESSEEEQNRYKKDLRYFLNLRSVVKQRFGETVDYSMYESQIRSLVEKYVGAEQVRELIPPVDITNVRALEAEIGQLEGDAAKADAIASRMRRTATVKMEEDPIYYQRLSKLIDDLIAEHRTKRLSDLEYFQQMQEMLHNVQGKVRSDIPEVLAQRDAAQAYYGILKDTFKDLNLGEDPLAQLALQLDDILLSHRVIDWHIKEDVLKAIQDDMDDALFTFKTSTGANIGYDLFDEVMERVIRVAKTRMN